MLIIKLQFFYIGYLIGCSRRITFIHNKQEIAIALFNYDILLTIILSHGTFVNFNILNNKPFQNEECFKPFRI